MLIFLYFFLLFLKDFSDFFRLLSSIQPSRRQHSSRLPVIPAIAKKKLWVAPSIHFLPLDMGPRQSRAFQMAPSAGPKIQKKSTFFKSAQIIPGLRIRRQKSSVLFFSKLQVGRTQTGRKKGPQALGLSPFRHQAACQLPG
jgi:hypothetical protein